MRRRHTEADPHALISTVGGTRLATPPDMKTDERPHESTPELIGGLITDAKDLAIAHLDGMRLELKEEFGDLKKATALAAAAAAALAVGALLAVNALVLVLWTYTGLPQWAAYGVIAIAFFAVGAAALIARKKVASDADLIPETSLKRMKRDAKFVARQARTTV